MYDIRLKENFKLFISGPSRCGKTFFVADLLQNIQTLVRAECVRQRNEVAIKLGIISLSSLLLSPPLSSSRRLLKTIEGGVVGF